MIEILLTFLSAAGYGAVYFFVILTLIGIGLCFVGNLVKKISVFECIIITIITGFAGWSIFIFITSWLHIRWLTPYTPILIALAGWYRYGRFLHWKIGFKKNWLLAVLLLLGVAAQLYVVAPSGMMYPDGMRFYGVNEHDGMWHAALMQSLSNPFPPVLPTYAGAELKGYHYLVDLFGNELVRDFRLSPFDLTFRFFPWLFSLVTGLGVYLFVKRLTHDRLAGMLAVALNYFGGSFGYVLPLLGINKIGAESSFWAQQGISTFLNLPLGVSLAVITVILILITHWLDDSSYIRPVIVAAMLVGSLVSIKAYGGILLLIAFVGALLLSILQTKNWRFLLPVGVAGLISTLFILISTDIKVGSFIIEPGWFLKTMMETGDRVGYPQWELLRQTYAAHNNIPRLLFLWGIAFIVFVAGNFGIRLLGGYAFIKTLFEYKKHIFPINTIIISVAALGVLLPTIFLQKGVVWNSIQFVYYSLFMMNILTAITVTSIQPWTLRRIVFFALLFITIPTTISTMALFSNLYRENHYTLISTEKIQVLQYAKQLSGTSPFVIPYDDTAYFTAFTGKPVYFTDKGQADILLLPTDDRLRKVNALYDYRLHDTDVSSFMHENGISYVYDMKNSSVQMMSLEKYPSLKKIFSNESSSIYQVQ